MLRLAADDTLLGLELLCLDDACARHVWRDFRDYPPGLTLRQLRARAVCDWCGSMRGKGVDVSVSQSVFSTPHPTPDMIADRATVHERRRRYRDEHPIRLRQIHRIKGFEPPHPTLIAMAHHRLGVPMCNLYANTTSQDAMRQMFGVQKDLLGNQPPQPAIFPDGQSVIVRRNGDGETEMTHARWGWNKAPFGWVTNARNMDKWPWTQIIDEPRHRCLVPASSFSEYHPTERDEKGHKKVVWFRLSGDQERPPFAFAGFVKRWRWAKDGLRKKSDLALAEESDAILAMSFCTCAANELVKPIHPNAMPVILRPDDYERWLTGSADDVHALQRPLPADEMEVAFIGGKADAAG